MRKNWLNMHTSTEKQMNTCMNTAVKEHDTVDFSTLREIGTHTRHRHGILHTHVMAQTCSDDEGHRMLAVERYDGIHGDLKCLGQGAEETSSLLGVGFLQLHRHHVSCVYTCMCVVFRQLM
jgi:hypothetical protein